MSPSKVLFLLCLSFVVGIFFQSVIKITPIFIWVILFLSIFLVFISFFSKKNYFAILGFCIIFLAIGVLRLQVSEFNIANDKLSKLNGTGEVVLSGIISNEPVLKDKSQQIKVKVEDSIVLVTTDRYPEYNYLDKVKITGKLETPMENEEFSYKNYLMKDGIYSVMGFPKIDFLGKEPKNFWSGIYSGILFLKQKFRESINKNFSPPESLILQGLILGDKTSIPQDIKNKFNFTGTSHIIAVSGTHIVILGSILMAFLLAIGLYRQQAFYFSVIFICFYIVLVGLPASGIRSGIMGILFLLGQKLGRQSTSSRIIVLAGALMLLQNPLLLFYDIGFQLSFLAVLGLIYFEPILRLFFKFLIKKVFSVWSFSGFKPALQGEIEEKQDSALMMFSATISAQIFTLPIIVYNFGNISFVSPLVNILVLPVVYYIMLFGFLSALVGAVLIGLGWFFSIPCYFLMLYFMLIVDLFSKNWAYKVIENVHWIWLWISYFAIGFMVWFLNKTLKNAKII